MAKIYRIIPTCLVVISCWLMISCVRSTTASSSTANGIQSQEAGTKKLSIVAKLKEYNHLPVGERIALYHQLKKDAPDTYDFANETELTLYGYSFLWENKTPDALAIFDLLIAEFPQSANAYDSMGEAYLQARDSAQALFYYSKSLEMNPDNYNAEHVIQKIKFPHIKPLTTREKFVEVHTQNEYRDDLDQLGARLMAVHPHPFKFITKEAFLKNIDDKKLLITDKTTYAEFAWHCHAIIASLGCSHTGASNMPNDYHLLSIMPVEQSFPLAVRWINNRLFIVDPMNNVDQVKAQEEIERINGVPVATLLSDIYNHIPAQAHIPTYKAHYFNTYFAALIPYALSLPTTFDIVVKGTAPAIRLHAAQAWATALYDPSHHACGEELCLEIVDGKTAVLTIASFNYYEWDRYPQFKSFLDSSMAIIHNKKIQHLIIDVRHNRGGSQYPSIYLLQHLMDNPFIYYSQAEFEGKSDKMYGEELIYPLENRFKGNVYFLIDGNGNSTTGHFMSLVKAHGLGTIIGEELGSNQFCTAGQTLCRLKNTKLVVSIANNTHVSTATQLPDNKGILPDIYVTQSIEEYLNNKDVVKERALRLIKEKN